MNGQSDDKFLEHILNHLNVASLDDYNKEFLKNVTDRFKARRPLSEKQKARLRLLWEKQNAKPR